MNYFVEMTHQGRKSLMIGPLKKADAEDLLPIVRKMARIQDPTSREAGFEVVRVTGRVDKPIRFTMERIAKYLEDQKEVSASVLC